MKVKMKDALSILRNQKENEILISERSGDQFDIEIINNKSKDVLNKKVNEILFRNSYVSENLFDELIKLLNKVTDFPEEEFEEEDNTIIIKRYGKGFKIGIISL